jgi:hypothetical protein
VASNFIRCKLTAQNICEAQRYYQVQTLATVADNAAGLNTLKWDPLKTPDTSLLRFYNSLIYNQ